ncbi:hypothetical protein N9J85_00615, partial [bacterium]|nr:hypothetical protein [bacterium]
MQSFPYLWLKESTMKKLIYLSLVLALVACGNQQEKTTETTVEVQDFEKFKSDFIDAMWQMNPISASYQGVHDYDNQLPIPNEERKQLQLQFATDWLNKLRAFDYETLSEADKIDFHLIEDDLSNTEFYVNEFKGGEWNPSSYNLGGAFFQVINYQKHPLEKR